MGRGSTRAIALSLGITKRVAEAVESLTHESTRSDPLARARHLAFLVTHLGVGIGASLAFPAFLAINGAPTGREGFFFAGLIAALPLAYYLSRSGDLLRAHTASSILTALVVVLVDPGTGSLGGAFLFVAILFAATSGSRRAVEIALGTGIMAVIGLALADVVHGRLDAGTGLDILALFGALGLASGIALAIVRLNRLEGMRAADGEARYLLLAENMNDVVLRHGAAGRVEFASPAARLSLDIEPEALRGHGFFERVNVADRPAYLAALATAERDGMTGSIELRVRAGEGTNQRTLWIDLRCRSVGEGDERTLVSVIRDISTRKMHDLEVEAARQAAESANASKGRFLATVSHELRTPLNAIIGFSEMLIHEDMIKLDGARRIEYAKLIHDSGQHLLSVVNGILDMSKLESGAFEIVPEPFDVETIFRSVIAMLKLKIEEGQITVRFEVQPDLPELVADKRACRQIILNLVSNALKFTPKGGLVTLGARLEKDGIALFVTDSGCGISASDVERLGEPFFQVRGTYDRPYEGTGLGLSVVKGLVALHGGRLDVESALGVGTQMIVRLPLDCECEASRAALGATATNVRRFPSASRPADGEKEKQRA